MYGNPWCVSSLRRRRLQGGKDQQPGEEMVALCVMIEDSAAQLYDGISACKERKQDVRSTILKHGLVAKKCQR